MRYISTRGQAPPLDFAGVLLAGLAEDGGLYVPESWPKISDIEISALQNCSYSEVAINLMSRFTMPSINMEDLSSIIVEAYNEFDHPLVAPLNEINPEWIHPENKVNIQLLLKKLKDTDINGIKKV